MTPVSQDLSKIPAAESKGGLFEEVYGCGLSVGFEGVEPDSGGENGDR